MELAFESGEVARRGVQFGVGVSDADMFVADPLDEPRPGQRRGGDAGSGRNGTQGVPVTVARCPSPSFDEPADHRVGELSLVGGGVVGTFATEKSAIRVP